jgi:lysophospholipase L1-like esterase
MQPNRRRWLEAAIGIVMTALAGPAGAHAPRHGATTDATWLALGDSYTIGEGVAIEGRWPMQVAQALRHDGIAIADPRIVATTGWTTDELSAALDAMEVASVGAASAASFPARDENQKLPAEAAPTKAYDLVSLLIGVNDQYRGRDVGDYRERFAALLERAIGYADGRADHVLVLSIPDWGVTPFAHRQGRDPARIARELDAYNAVARTLCVERGVAFVDITAASRERGAETGMLVDDGLHPSAAMYAQWARIALPVARGLLGR